MKTRVINLKAVVSTKTRRGGWLKEPSIKCREERRTATHTGYGPDDEPGWLEDTTLGY